MNVRSHVRDVNCLSSLRSFWSFIILVFMMLLSVVVAFIETLFQFKHL